jgi:trimeric autotransporter adhesin
MKAMNKTLQSLLVALGLYFGLGVVSQAVLPPPDGDYPGGNTAEGQNALFSLTSGSFNTAVGFLSLRSDTTGQLNTAVGAGALLADTAENNTAMGGAALLNNTTGAANTANGALALFSNTSGATNAAVGIEALYQNTTGNSNTAVGSLAGFNQTTGSNNVYIGANTVGVAGENNACYIASIYGQTSPGGTQVFINSDSKLGTMTSSKRFKEKIKPMDRASEALFALQPVAFHYKKEIDPAGMRQFGLVAEDVEIVNPDLVVRDKEGKPYSVRYDQVNAMLLNEFLKEHGKVEQQGREISNQNTIISELESTVARQQKSFQSKLVEQENQIEALRSGLQKVSAQMEMMKPATQIVVNEP